ncbi:hypothetical protein ENSA5_38700 [Enhygromyxa salina]|uniref:DUF3540 domain-containing protein n=1 Tax=Enhygromyxa salina TaxID=215803 RepID=A0A2S9XRM8_9BACT|nr:DUF3540 domain-containing protein [Enhygromyxa salina]PRP95517.1 hypothetical protein ENSA5_38700 [Enhygromyxa salina]
MHVRELEIVSDPIPEPARQGTAIIRAGGPSFVLDDEGRRFEARRAASCLLEPELGDEVWFVEQGARCYVLGVLERASEAGAATLSIEGDAALRVGGELSVDASAGLELRSDEQVGISGDEVRVQARLGRVVFDECTAVLRSMLAHVTNFSFVAKVIETLTERLTLASKTSFRSVAEVDQIQAGVIDYRAKEAAHIAADKALINGGKLAKVEAGQIHLG